MSGSPPNQSGSGPSSDQTRIIRRQTGGPLAPPPAREDARTIIIQRRPTGPVRPPEEPQTGLITPQHASEAATGYIPRARPATIPQTAAGASPNSAIAAAVLTILGGWATIGIATDLIAGWWHTDRLFCVAVGFLAAVSAAASIGGVILLLLRRRMGRLLIVVGAVIGVAIFASLFVAGARLPTAVYVMPVLPLAGIALTLLPSTRRWSRSD